jgi:hypothetical protein
MKKAPRRGALVAAGVWLFCCFVGWVSAGEDGSHESWRCWRVTRRRRLLDGEAAGYAPRGASACGSGRGAALDKHYLFRRRQAAKTRKNRRPDTFKMP